MLTIQKIDGQFVAKSGDECLGSIDFETGQNSVIMKNLQCQDNPLSDGLIRACVAYHLDRGFVYFEAGDQSVLDGFEKMPCGNIDLAQKQHSAVSLLNSCHSCKKCL